MKKHQQVDLKNPMRRQFIKNSAISITGLFFSYKSLQASSINKFLDNVNNSYSLEINLDKVKMAKTFPLGVASGDVLHDRAILWTRYYGNSELYLIIYEKINQEQDLQIHFDKVKFYDDNYVNIDIRGLEPNKKYRYAFLEIKQQDIKRSHIGSFKTAPASDQVLPLTIGACCCTYNNFTLKTLEHAGTREDLDLFMLLGDTSYNDGCESLQEFRDSWAGSLSRKGYVDLRKSTSVIATLDDHELSNDFNPETINESILRAGKRAFFNNLPIRRDDTQRDKIWRKFRWGKTAEIFMLDSRTERLPSTRKTSRARYLSQQQMQWLKESLLSSDAVFKIIGNSVPITDFPHIFNIMNKDRWEGYPAQRYEILHFIEQNNIKNVLWVSGDFHFACVAKVAKRGLGSNAMEVLVGPGGNMPNMLGDALVFNSQFDWVSSENNYATFALDPINEKIKIEYMVGGSDPRAVSSVKITKGFSRQYSLR